MGNKIVMVVIGFIFGVLVTIASSSYWLHYFPNNLKRPALISLEEQQKGNILLYAELRNGFLVGKYFNKNTEITVTQITVEAVPKDEKNPFNQFSPRFFNINISALPRTMSPAFEVEAGALNPEFHSLKIAEAKGYSD